jgi:hypothetical protein
MDEISFEPDRKPVDGAVVWIESAGGARDADAGSAAWPRAHRFLVGRPARRRAARRAVPKP